MLKNKSDFAREKKRKTKNWRKKIWSQKNKLCSRSSQWFCVPIKAQFTSAKESGQEESGRSSQRSLWKGPFSTLNLAVYVGAERERIPGLKKHDSAKIVLGNRGWGGNVYIYLIWWALISQKNKKPFSFWSYPFTPFLGGLLLNWRVCLCLNLGGPLRGVVGPWFEVGGANTVLSLILLMCRWLMVFFQALWTVREKERKIIQCMKTIAY